MQLPAIQTISSRATDTNFIFLVGINTSYFGSVRICMPKVVPRELGKKILLSTRLRINETIP
jgi:hypothetical protein